MKNKTLQECLNYIQVNLKAPKNMHNNFGNYKYRNLEGILEGLKPLLEETGCIITITHTVEMVGDRYYIVATASLKKGEEVISCKGWARESEYKKRNGFISNHGVVRIVCRQICSFKFVRTLWRGKGCGFNGQSQYSNRRSENRVSRTS